MNGRTVYTQRDVTGGEDLGFEPILFEGCPDSAYRRPFGSQRAIHRNVQETGAIQRLYLPVDAAQTTGGQTRTATSPKALAAATPFFSTAAIRGCGRLLAGAGL